MPPAASRSSLDGQLGATASPGGGDHPSNGDAKLADSLRQIDRRFAALEIKQTMATLGKGAEAQAAGEGAVLPAGSKGGPVVEALKEKASRGAAAIDAVLRTEARDGAWATTTEKQVQSAVAAVAKDGTQISIKADPVHDEAYGDAPPLPERLPAA